MLNGFLEHLTRDKSLRKHHGSQVCGCVLSQWSKLGSWWGERFSADQRLGAINLLKKLLSLEPKVRPCLVIEQERGREKSECETGCLKYDRQVQQFLSSSFFPAADPGESCGAGAGSEHVSRSTGGDKELPHLQGTWGAWLNCSFSSLCLCRATCCSAVCSSTPRHCCSTVVLNDHV